MSESIVINEIYLSVQGESTFAGLPCIFIRLTACNLRCSYCDTAYAFNAGTRRPLGEVRAEVKRLAAPFAQQVLTSGSLRLPLVELTGGEPLLQKSSLPLMTQLCDDGFTVLLETSGAHDIAPVDGRVRRIMDLKCPSSGEDSRNRWENVRSLRTTDEIKFVIGDRHDFDWSVRIVRKFKLEKHPLLFAPVFGELPYELLCRWIVESGLTVRFQPQLHKHIWPPDTRGV